MFLGSSGKGAKPVPLPPEEINAILRNIGLMEKPSYDFVVGEKVLIINGPFKDKKVEISAVNEEKETLTVLLEFLGRYTPTEVAFTDVLKSNEGEE